MARRKGFKVLKWSFWWPCLRCDQVMGFLVNEVENQDKVFARCPRCSSLLEVGRDHRECRIEV